MEFVYKTAAISLLACIFGLLLRKSNPEGSLLLSVAVVVGTLTVSVGMLNGLKEIRAEIMNLLGNGAFYLIPMIKCLAIALITHFADGLCRDSSQNAVGSAVELSGTVGAVTVVLPMLMSVLKMIGGLV